MTHLIRKECNVFLLNLVSAKPNSELLEALRDRIREADAWDELVLHANRNRVSGLALYNLGRLNHRSLIPETAIVALRKRTSVFVDKYPTTVQNLADIHASFTAAQLPYLLFK
ncbi:MAG: hypothetical protein O7D94_07010, partial [Planctomycetota bacterium]|nr:hypothetical protein [Planctomycetota bacterium]